jgi:hypothetical protein
MLLVEPLRLQGNGNKTQAFMKLFVVRGIENSFTMPGPIRMLVSIKISLFDETLHPGRLEVSEQGSSGTRPFSNQGSACQG